MKKPVIKEGSLTVKMKICSNIVDEIIGSATIHGESLLLHKEISKRFKDRPVVKDVFTCYKDFEFEIQNAIPSSISCANNVARVQYVDS